MQGEVQQFASAPKAVGQRQKYRDDTTDLRNIMHDPRVVRGNTYASLVVPQNDAAEVKKQREAQRRRLMMANRTKRRPGTPEPVSGRKHMDIQTDSYLEELTERTVEFEAETQTDFLLDRPPSPLFMPTKIGYDCGTQIEDGELFDFDREVEPVLEVLVGKTLEQSMMEVLEEEELASLRRHQEEFERRRNAELQEVQRMEAAERRRQEEMERRMQQQAAQREQDLSTMRKVVSRSIAASYLGGMRERCLAHLQDAGVFADAVQLAVDSKFVPQLMQAVMKQMEQQRQDQDVFGNISRSFCEASTQTHAVALDVERKRLQAIDDAERKIRQIREHEKQMREQESARIQEEQSKMLEWERYQPPEPVEELPEVMDVSEEDFAVTMADETIARVGEEMPQVREMWNNKTPEQKLVCKITDEGENGIFATDFRLEEKSVPEEDNAAPAPDGTDNA